MQHPQKRSSLLFKLWCELDTVLDTLGDVENSECLGAHKPDGRI